MRRKLFGFTLALLLTLTACGPSADTPDKPVILCTLFPQYDFARTIAGDAFDVRLMLPPGVEAHLFEPVPGDTVSLGTAVLFIYTGAEMEPWAARFLEARQTEGLAVVDGSASVPYPLEAHEHDHGEGLSEPEADPHFWLDLRNAARFAREIGTAIEKLDPANGQTYQARTEALCGALLDLDEQLLAAVRDGERQTVAFGGRFAYAYFVTRYGLEYVSAYDGCSTETEPSLKAMLSVEAYIKEHGLPCVFHEELASTAAADTLAKAAGAESVLLHTCHNISKEDREHGVTFLALMEGNLEALERALN